jgi:hypothetical protein
MKTSAFTTTGLLKLSSEQPLAKRLYGAVRAALGPALAGETTEFTDAFSYAFAMAVARSATLLERAFGQMLPSEVTDLLAAKEAEYGLIPLPNASITARRSALAARMLLPGGAGRLNVENALRALLGAAFVGYHTTTPAERAAWPHELGATPQNLQLPSAARKIVRLMSPISMGLGKPQAVTYRAVDPLAPSGSHHVLAINDRLVVEVEHLSRAEVVTVAALGDTHTTGLTFTATFEKAHEPGCWGTTQTFPVWTSTQRFALVVVAAAAALDPETQRQIHELMERLARGVSTWAIVQATGRNQAGPFVLGKSPLGVTPLGTIVV